MYRVLAVGLRAAVKAPLAGTMLKVVMGLDVTEGLERMLRDCCSNCCCHLDAIVACSLNRLTIDGLRGGVDYRVAAWRLVGKDGETIA